MSFQLTNIVAGQTYYLQSRHTLLLELGNTGNLFWLAEMDDTRESRILDRARRHYAHTSQIPHFAQERGTTQDGERKQVILPTADGIFPRSPRAPRMEITARLLPWDHTLVFWTMEIGRETHIVKLVGRLPDGRATYRRWLGVELLHTRDGFGKANIAFDVPSSTPSVERWITLEREVQKMLDADRQHYENKGHRPPFVSVTKNITDAVTVGAFLVGKNGETTNDIVAILKVGWNKGEVFWLADIRGEQQVFAEVKGNGRKFYQWRGHALGIDRSRVVAISLPGVQITGAQPGSSISSGQVGVCQTDFSGETVGQSRSIGTGRLTKGFKPHGGRWGPTSALSSPTTSNIGSTSRQSHTSPAPEAPMVPKLSRALLKAEEEAQDDVERGIIQRPMKRAKPTSIAQELRCGSTAIDTPTCESASSEGDSESSRTLTPGAMAVREMGDQPSNSPQSARHCRNPSPFGTLSVNVQVVDDDFTVSRPQHLVSTHR